jgi:radical SAM superfamily enzyme YgiQ (UPF0313 family)
MRVLLVNPPFYRLMGSHYNGLSLGLAYVAASLNEAGHDAWLYNADFLPTVDYPTQHGLYQASPRVHIDAAHPLVIEAAASIHDFQPDVVGYTCYTANVPMIAAISRLVAGMLPATLQIVGGPHASLDGAILSHLPDIDYAVQGEGERAMQALLAATLHGGGHMKVARIADLDPLPLPERTKLWGPSRPLSHADWAYADVSSIVTARGCPWRCRYCASQFIWPRVVARGVTSVVREVATVASRWPEQQIHFVDDTLTYNEDRALAIIRGMKHLGLPLRWRCEARADTITLKIAAAMAESGCEVVKLGIESGSDRILKAMRKGETTADMMRATGLLQYHGIKVTAYLMAAYPGETDDDLRQTIDFARRLHADSYSISLATPYYGTPLYQDAIAAGLAVDKAPWECFFHQSAAMLLNPNLSRELLEELWSLGNQNGRK